LLDRGKKRRREKRMRGKGEREQKKEIKEEN
jgi:hypothetical protein